MKPGEERRGGGRGGEALEAELFHQPILQRAVGALDPALRLRALGAEAVDVELAEGAPALGEPGAALGAVAGLDVEDAQPVAVERHRLAVPLEVAPGRLEGVEGRLGRREAELHQPAGRIVDVDQQRAARAAALEPSVLAAVDLDELAQTGAALAWRITAPGPLRPGHPEARRTHPPPQRLDRAHEGVLLGELLVGERGAEVGVTRADEGQGALARRGREAPRARAPAPARHESCSTGLDEGAIEASHLALAEPQQRRRPPARQAPLGEAGHDVQALQFLHAQRERSGHPGTVPEKRTSLLWRNRTFALGAYRRTSGMGRSVNFHGTAFEVPIGHSLAGAPDAAGADAYDWLVTGSPTVLKPGESYSSNTTPVARGGTN